MYLDDSYIAIRYERAVNTLFIMVKKGVVNMNEELYEIAKRYIDKLDPKKIKDIDVRKVTDDYVYENGKQEHRIDISIEYEVK